jgi:hypothetical protein
MWTRFLPGTRPDEISVEQPTKFDRRKSKRLNIRYLSAASRGRISLAVSA